MKFVPEWLLGRMHRLKVAAQEARRASEGASTALLRLRTELEDASAHLERATVPSGEMRQEVGERVQARQKELTEKIAKLEPEVALQKEIADRAQEFEIATNAVFERCAGWIDSGIHADDDALEKVEIALPDDPASRAKEIEVELVALADEAQRVVAAPTARVDVENAVRSYLSNLRKTCEPTVTVAKDGHVDISLAKTGKKVDLAYFPGRKVTPESLLSLLLWLDPDIIEQKLLSIVDRIPAHVDAVPLEAKTRHLEEIAGRRSAAMYELGALVRACIEAGTLVEISKALEAEHVLGVKVVRAATEIAA